MPDYKMDWLADHILKITTRSMDKSSKEIAESINKDAAKILKQKAKTTTEKGLLSQFSIEKSKFKDGGYLSYNQGPGKQTGKYHASFVELGSWVYPYGDKTKKKIHLPPKPFMRPARKINQRKSTKVYQENLDRELAKL